MRAVKEKMETPFASAAVAVGALEKLRSYPARVRQFLHDVRLEMRNVTWPAWKDVQATTVVVVVTTFFFGFFLGFFLDRLLLGPGITWLMKTGKELLK